MGGPEKKNIRAIVDGVESLRTASECIRLASGGCNVRVYDDDVRDRIFKANKRRGSPCQVATINRKIYITPIPGKQPLNTATHRVRKRWTDGVPACLRPVRPETMGSLPNRERQVTA